MAEGLPGVFFTIDGDQIPAVTDVDDMLADEVLAAERHYGPNESWTTYAYGLVCVAVSLARERDGFPLDAPRRWTNGELNRISKEITDSKAKRDAAAGEPESVEDEPARPTVPADAAE